MFANCNQNAHLTLTAIHPTENKSVPSRHIPLGGIATLHDALERLHAANGMGWGAYYGLATRRSDLTRWQRGDMKALVEIPALISDIDESPEVALPRIRAFPISPSCIVSSGHGVHVYWLLDRPTTNMQAVNAIHRGLAQALKGDYLTAATALRLPGSLNTKHDTTAPCEVLESDWSRRYMLTDFALYQRTHTIQKANRQRSATPSQSRNSPPVTLDPSLIQTVADVLLSQGFKWCATWLNGSCPYAHLHKHADRRPSFGFNTATGYGFCFVCGVVLPAQMWNAFA